MTISNSNYAYTPPVFTLSNNVKFVVFVPESHADIVRKAIHANGGGVIGNYKNCSFTTTGTARFSEYQYESISTVNEERIETVVPSESLRTLIEKVEEVHPYRKMGYDIYPLLSKL